MKTATTLQENVEDIYSDAKSINEERAAAEEAEFEDVEVELTEDEEEQASEE